MRNCRDQTLSRHSIADGCHRRRTRTPGNRCSDVLCAVIAESSGGFELFRRPCSNDGIAGVTTMDTRVAFTVSVTVPLTLPEVAVMVVEPAALALTIPPLEIVATLVLDEIHETELVRSFVPPLLLYVPVAVNCSVAPIRSVRFAAVT